MPHDSDVYAKKLRKKYPIETIEKHIEKIEQLGYIVTLTDYQCQIFDGSTLLIDADFFEDMHTNAADAIESFYTK